MNLLQPKVMIPIAILAGAIATLGAYKIIENKSRKAEMAVVETRPVVVAAVQLEIGDVLGPENLMVKDWPADLAPSHSYSSVDMLRDRVLKTPLTPGEPVLPSKLAPEGSIGGFSSLIPPGMRAMTVPVNVVSGVGGFILPKTRVDVLVTASPSISKEEATAKILLQNVEVMAIDQTVEKDDTSPMAVKSVTLLVTPEQAGKLALAMNEGTLQLALRNGADANQSTDDGVVLKELFGRKEQPEPKRPVRAYRPVVKKEEPKEAPKRIVEVIRSNERSEVSFEETDK